jgi:dipeptidyl-peptidase-4
MRDDTVLFQDTLTLAQRLILADKDFEIAVLPDAPHGWDTQGLAQTRYAFRRLVSFFDRYLHPHAPL